jgi:peroxiredoxin
VSARAQKQLLQPGRQAEPFALPDLDGKLETLENAVAGSRAVLVFFKVTCPTCQYTLPFLQRLHQAGIRVIGISQDSAEDTREFATEFGLDFPMLLDAANTNYAASNAYGISYVPSIFLVEAGGAVAVSWDGFSRADLAGLARRMDVPLFRPDENVPAWRAG